MNEEQLQEPTVRKIKFSWLRIAKTVFVIVIIVAIPAGIYFFVTWRPVKITWASLVLDRREHYSSCAELPFFVQVQKAFSQHSDIVQKVKAIPGVVDFRPEEDDCVNFTGGLEFLKGQAVLEYKNRTARYQAQSLIGKDFFGIPYRGYSG